MEINIINDEHYRFLREMLGKRSSSNSWDTFLIEEDNSISIEGKKVYVELSIVLAGKIKDGMFLKIVGSRQESDFIRITLAEYENAAGLFDMPT